MTPLSRWWLPWSALYCLSRLRISHFPRRRPILTIVQGRPNVLPVLRASRRYKFWSVSLGAKAPNSTTTLARRNSQSRSCRCGGGACVVVLTLLRSFLSDRTSKSFPIPVLPSVSSDPVDTRSTSALANRDSCMCSVHRFRLSCRTDVVQTARCRCKCNDHSGNKHNSNPSCQRSFEQQTL